MVDACPEGFQHNPLNPTGCVKECPRTNGFRSSTRLGVAVCEYTARPSLFFYLRAVPTVRISASIPAPTVAQLQQSYSPSIYREYAAAVEEYTQNFAIAMATLTREAQISDAFRALQTAEGVRDTAPQAYQDARTRYYTLLNGESWVEEEKARIGRAEADPLVARYRSTIENVEVQRTAQQQTMEVMRNVRDKVLSMKDDFQYSVNTFGKQIDSLKNQINIEGKQRKATEHEARSWIETILNYILTALLVVLVGVLAVKVYRARSVGVPTTVSDMK